MPAEGAAPATDSPGGRRLLRAAGTVMAAYVLSRVLGLAREVAISSRFGTGPELDAYLAAFRVPDILFQLMAGGALASAFIPTFAGLLAKGEEREAWRLVSDLFKAIVLGVGLLSVLAAVLALPVVRYVVAPGFTAEQQALTANLMRIMLLTPIVFSVSGVFMGILNSHHRFLAAALAPCAYNLAIIFGAVALSPRMGAYGLALGVAIGAVLHYCVQLPQVWRLLRAGTTGESTTSTAPPLRRPAGSRASPVPAAGATSWVSPHLREVLRLMLPRAVGLAAVQVNFLVNTILASTMSPGSLSTINYAWILMLLPQGVFAQGIATVVFPTFSSLAAKDDRDGLVGLLLRAVSAVLFLSVPATIGLLVLRGPIVSLVYERQAFGVDSRSAVARVLAFYALGLCAHSGLEVLTRAYYSLHDTRTPVMVGVAAMLLNVVLSLVLRQPLREGGLALANTVATWIEFALLWFIFARRLPGLTLRPLVPGTLRVGLASLVMLVVVLEVGALPMAPALQGLLGIALGAAVYGMMSLWLQVPEAIMLYAQALTALRRP